MTKAFEELIDYRWKTQRYLLMDNGKEVMNKNLKKVLNECRTKHVTTLSYYPQANPVGHSNHTLKKMIAIYVGKNHSIWDKHLHELRHAINTATNATTKVSPYFFNFDCRLCSVKSLRREAEDLGLTSRFALEDWLDLVKKLSAFKDLVTKFIEQV